MSLYLDTSAALKLVAAEPGSDLVRGAWRDDGLLISSKLTNVEATAALARMRRAGRSDDRSNLERTSSWERLWGAIGAAAVDDLVIERALGVARSHGLRGYDAVQLASALCVDGRPAFLSFGVELNAAARAEGLTVLGPLA